MDGRFKPGGSEIVEIAEERADRLGSRHVSAASIRAESVVDMTAACLA